MAFILNTPSLHKEVKRRRAEAMVSDLRMLLWLCPRKSPTIRRSETYRVCVHCPYPGVHATQNRCERGRTEPLSTANQQHARRTRFPRADWQELAGKAKGIHLLQPSNVLPEELSFTDNGALINGYSWFPGSQSSCTQGTFLACGLQINRHPCPRAGCELQPCWIMFHFPASELEAILFLSFLGSTSKIRSF